MRETDYAYAVTRIKVNELKLLKQSDIEQIISANNYKEVIAHLSDKISGENYDEYLKQQILDAWGLLKEVAPDIHELDMLIVKNDFQNLKAILKGLMTGNSENLYMAEPSIIEGEQLFKAVREHDFESLPEFIRSSAKKAYDLITSTNNGQLSDVIIDRAALETIKDMSKTSKNAFLSELAEAICASANIKIAYRAIMTGKDKKFFQDALCDCDTLPKEELIEASLKGEKEFFEYLSSTKYANGAKALKKSTTSFEQWCDDIIIELALKVKHKSFGVEPLVAYYLAKEAEVKMIRIILSAKYNNLSSNIIRERMRKLYV